MQDRNTIEEAHICLVKIILRAAEKTIHKTTPETKKKPPVVWWNKERIVGAEYRNYCRDPTNTTKLISFQHRRAIKQSLNSLNSRTPTMKVWDKFRKVKENIFTSLDEIADIFADH